MHGPSLQAHLTDVEHPHLFAVHLGESKVAGSWREFVPTTEKPPWPSRDVPPDGRIGISGVAKAEVSRPALR
jgi:hypothetical protein